MARVRKARPTEPTRREACHASGKRKHTKKSAMGMVNHQVASGKAGVPLNIYKCPHCRSYHLTSRAQRNTQDVDTQQHLGNGGLSG